MEGSVLFLVVLLCFAIYAVWTKHQTLRRAEFIRTYSWPPGLLDKLTQNNPALGRKEAALASRALRQYFIAYLKSGQRFVAMPSRVVDDLWHEFILYTRDYEAFCERAFDGFLHHIPASSLQSAWDADHEKDGLSRVWFQACADENINPLEPTRLPLLFALDTKLNIANGFHYDLEPNGNAMMLANKLRENRKRSSGGAGCGGGCGGDGGCGGGGCGGGCGGE